MRVTKMHGLGNDYLLLDWLELEARSLAAAQLRKLAVKLSDRRRGLGADGLILVRPSHKAAAYMEMYNSDGSPGEMCGNGIRCLASYLYWKGWVKQASFPIDTPAGIRQVELLKVSQGFLEEPIQVRVRMGVPQIDAPRQVEIAEIGSLLVQPVSMGNPHCVLFIQNSPDSVELPALGIPLEHHESFPNRTNVELVQVTETDRLNMRVWERGSGETLACGTGACAAAAAFLKTPRQKHVTVELPGGELDIFWDPEDLAMYLTGPAQFVYEAEVTDQMID